MLYQGQTLTVAVDDGIATLCFDAGEKAVNKFDGTTLDEFAAAIEALYGAAKLRGLLVVSGRPDFIVGADITEFGAQFRLPAEALRRWVADINDVFNRLEDLAVPSVAAVNGNALGGGLETALATDYRVMADNARIGFPETQLGILPGFGGLVRAPRLIGADNAIEWIADGKPRDAGKALAAGMVDAVVDDDRLHAAARDLLDRAIDGVFDWRARRAEKTGPLGLNRVDAALSFETAKAFIAGKTGGHYPAPIEAVERMAEGATHARDAALEPEHDGFVKLAQTPEADALIQLFLNDQLIKKKGRGYARQAHGIDRVAVLGAGIMGGGIAYQAAAKGLPAVLKDIKPAAVDAGLAEAGKLFAKAADRGRLDNAGVAAGMARIRPALGFAEFDGVDAVIEAVVENPKIKHAALAEVEAEVEASTIIASNTSSIAIDTLAEAMSRPANFLGMHFFNPVHRMPLVEVIRGSQTSDTAVATIVDLAQRLGKTPVVVGDCPGFLVNRVLFPYFFGFMQLVADGGDFVEIDRAMTRFGWPMGPAHLSDVVGMDTCRHVETILAAGYPDRMARDERSVLDALVEAGRLGQKSGGGYYDYASDARGRHTKTPSDAAYTLVADLQTDGSASIDAEQTVDRLLVPMIIEAARALEDQVADTPNEIDTALIMGLGFPPFRGGALKYADTRGLDVICAAADRYSHLGALYQPTERMRALASAGDGFYEHGRENAR